MTLRCHGHTRPTQTPINHFFLALNCHEHCLVSMFCDVCGTGFQKGDLRPQSKFCPMCGEQLQKWIIGSIHGTTPHSQTTKPTTIQLVDLQQNVFSRLVLKNPQTIMRTQLDQIRNEGHQPKEIVSRNRQNGTLPLKCAQPPKYQESHREMHQNI